MKVNKKILFILFFLITIFLSLDSINALEYINEETNYKVIIEDEADLLSDSEIDLLKEKMMPLTEYGNIAFKSIDYNYTTADNYARSYYHEQFGVQSGTLFLIDMYNRKIYIFSDGANYRTITNSKANIITDNIYTYASREEYYTCSYKAFDQIHTLLEGGKIAEPMRYISNILIAITLSGLLGFVVVLVNTKINRPTYEQILRNCKIDFNVSDTSAVKTGTHSEYSPVSDSSSSSGGGGSFGGGGGSSGGGGGHSF